MVRDADQILMDLIIHLLEVQHHQIGHFQQLINHRIVATDKAVGIQAGMNALFMAGAEPVTNELSLQDRLSAGSRHTATRGVHKVAVGHYLFH